MLLVILVAVVYPLIGLRRYRASSTCPNPCRRARGCASTGA
jgi:hypothetical protein